MARKKVLTEAEEMEKRARQTELRRLRNQRYHLKRKQYVTNPIRIRTFNRLTYLL